jgi:histidinol dehydrogenase
VRVERLDARALPDGYDARGRLLSGPAAVAERLRKLAPPPGDARDVVTQILSVVAHEGDEAVLEYTRELDLAGVAPRPLRVPAEELDEAIVRLPLEVVAGLQVAIANVAAVAQVGVGEDVSVHLPQGHSVTVRELPVDSAAVYVPGGRAPYPSTAVMGVVTARAAGVADVVVCSPPGRDGQVDPLILGTCRLLGVERVYRMGGAQAVAALAYGTETVQRVDVVVGPGNVYVQEAKRKLSDVVGIDSFAGPSDLLVVLGTDADPRLLALDLLAQAEHGAGSFVAALSPSADALDALAAEVQRLTAQDASATAGATGASGTGATGAGAEGVAPEAVTAPPRPHAPRCVLVQTADVRAAVEIANEYAPEHLQLVGAEPEALAPQVRRAGCVFVGASAGTAFGDYVAGSNHILPTAGAARFASGLSPRHFRRHQAEVRLGAVGGDAVRKLAAAGAPVARAEGFEWHARSMEARAAGGLAVESPTAGAPSEPPLGENEA